MISIIVPVYNVEKYLRRCLDSLLEQTYSALQIILIDDGSTDASGDICDEYRLKDSRIEVLHKQNGGVAEARNDGLSLAKGKYIGFVDADDYVEKDMFMTLHEVLIKEAAELAVCGYYEEYTDRTLKRGEGLGVAVYDNTKIYEDYFKMGGRLGSGTWNKLFKASVLEGIRYKKYVVGEDVEMLTRALLNVSKAVVTDYAGYHYIHREDSATQLKFRPDNMDIIRAVDDMVIFIKNNRPELLPNMYAFHASWHVATLQVMNKAGDTSAYGDEKERLRRNIIKNMPNYEGNPYIYKVDMILLKSYLHHCFRLCQGMLDLYHKLR